MADKILTISVSAYNVERFIEQALTSICIRDIDKLDILIINDGSKDNTLKIANKYEKMYPTSFRVIDKPNGGYGTTIKKGLEYAIGKYFTVLDGDDWFDSVELQKLINKLVEHDEDIVFWNMIYMYEDGKVKKEDLFGGIIPERTYCWSDTNTIFNVIIHGMAIKTGLYRKVNYQISDFFYVDIEFDVFCILAANTFAYFDLDVYMYRYGQAEQSVSPVSMQKNYQMLEEITIRLCEIYEAEKQKLDIIKRKFVINRIANLAYTTYTVALSYKVSIESKNRFYGYMNKLVSKDILACIQSKKKLFAISRKYSMLYRPIAGMYRKLKGIK